MCFELRILIRLLNMLLMDKTFLKNIFYRMDFVYFISIIFIVLYPLPYWQHNVALL